MLVAQGGCRWLRFWQEPKPPQILPPGAGLEQVIAAVNHNNAQIQSLFSNSATISVPGYPTLKARIAFQRPRNFRLKADGFGPEVDLGSNDQYFWFWIKRSQPPAVYICRHDQFFTSRARQMIPIDPNLLFEALGTLQLDPSLPHQGPYPDKGNRIQIRTLYETPEGPNTRVTTIDAASAWVMEQQIYRRPRAAAGPLGGRELSPRSGDKAVCSHGRARGVSRGAILDAHRARHGSSQPVAGRPGRVVERTRLSRFAAGRLGQSEPALRPAAGDVRRAVAAVFGRLQSMVG